MIKFSVLAPKALSHASLGHRPRIRCRLTQALKARLNCQMVLNPKHAVPRNNAMPMEQSDNLIALSALVLWGHESGRAQVGR